MASVKPRLLKDGTKSWQAKVRIKGTSPVSATFPNKTDAKLWAQSVEAEIRQDKYFPQSKAKRKTVADLIGQYLNHIRLKNPRRWAEVRPLLHWWEKQLGHIILSHFSTEDVLKGQHKLMKQPRQRRTSGCETVLLSPATVNRHVVALHTAIGFGIRSLKWINENPVNFIDKLDEGNGRIRFLSTDEIDRLAEACRASGNKYLLPLMILGIATGARRQEIATMTWENLNVAKDRITLPKTKNGKIRALHLQNAAAQVIGKMWASRVADSGLIFPSPNDPTRPIDFESAWRVALKRANISNFRFHDLRHTCASYLIMNGASTIEVAEILGHRTLAMVQRYAHLADTHTSKVVGQMTEKVLGHVEL